MYFWARNESRVRPEMTSPWSTRMRHAGRAGAGQPALRCARRHPACRLRGRTALERKHASQPRRYVRRLPVCDHSSGWLSSRVHQECTRRRGKPFLPSHRPASAPAAAAMHAAPSPLYTLNASNDVILNSSSKVITSTTSRVVVSSTTTFMFATTVGLSPALPTWV